jgi:hypothetical protein
MKHNQIGTETYRSFQQHAQLHSTRTIKIHRNSTIMHSPAQITHLATKAHTYSNNSSTNFQWQLFKAGESTTTQQPNPNPIHRPNPKQTKRQHPQLSGTAPLTHAPNLREAAASDDWMRRGVLTGEAAERPVMRQNMAAAAAGWAAADLGFGAPGSAKPRAGPRESGRRRPNWAGGEGGSDRESRRADRIGIARWGEAGKKGGARTHAHTREDEKRAIRASVSVLRRAVWVKFWFGLDWSGSGALLLSPRQKGRRWMITREFLFLLRFISKRSRSLFIYLFTKEVLPDVALVHGVILLIRLQKMSL